MRVRHNSVSRPFQSQFHFEQKLVTPSPGGGAIVPGFKPPLEAPRFRFRSPTDETICPACGLPEAPVSKQELFVGPYASCRYNQAIEQWARAYLNQAFCDINNVVGPERAGRFVREFAQQLPEPPPTWSRRRFRNPKKRTLVIKEFEQLQSQDHGITDNEAAKLIYAKYPGLWSVSDRTAAKNGDSRAAITAIEKMLQRHRAENRKSSELGRRLLEAVGILDGHFDFFQNVR